jgi:hypothetical protein
LQVPYSTAAKAIVNLVWEIWNRSLNSLMGKL